MEKVISLLAPRAGSNDGRLVPRPAKKHNEAARPPRCIRERAHAHDRSRLCKWSRAQLTPRKKSCVVQVEPQVEEETRGRHATTRHR